MHPTVEQALGPKVVEVIRSRKASDIIIRPHGIAVHWFKSGWQVFCEKLPSESYTDVVLRTVSSSLRPKRVVDYDHRILDCAIDENVRFAGLYDGLASIATIRIGGNEVRTFERDLEEGSIRPDQVQTIKRIIKARAAILFVGGPGTSKTTRLNTCLGYATEVHGATTHFVIIEDTPEIICTAPFRTFILTSESLPMRRAVFASQRHATQCTVAGEVRDGAALEVLKAWNSGTGGGMMTVHANDAAAGLRKLESYVREADQDGGSGFVYDLIQDAVDFVVTVGRITVRKEDGWATQYVVRDISEVVGRTESGWRVQSIFG